MTNKFGEILSFQTRRIFNVLAKRFLILLEDLQNEHNIHFDKLRQSLPDEYLPLLLQADYFDKSKFAHYRKRVLDCIGDGYREANEEIEKYDINIKRTKANETHYGSEGVGEFNQQ